MLVAIGSTLGFELVLCGRCIGFVLELYWYWYWCYVGRGLVSFCYLSEQFCIELVLRGYCIGFVLVLYWYRFGIVLELD